MTPKGSRITAPGANPGLNVKKSDELRRSDRNKLPAAPSELECRANRYPGFTPRALILASFGGKMQQAKNGNEAGHPFAGGGVAESRNRSLVANQDISHSGIFKKQTLAHPLRNVCIFK